MATECLTLNQSYNKMSRDIEDALRLKIDPPLAVDEVMMSKTQAESKTLRRPGNRIRGKLSMGEFIKGILPPEAYNVQADHFLFVEKIESKIKDILGLPDLRNLQKARQIPSSDSIEKFFAEAGSIVTDMSRSLDPVMWQIADMNRYYFFQFYNFERRIKILGKDGITEVDFDFNPGSLIPQDSQDQSGWLEKAKRHVQNFSTDIEPTSLHEISSMSNRLLKLQAKKLSPFLVSDETLAKTLNIQNWGTSEGDTEREKVVSEVKLQQNLGLQAQFDQMKLQLLGQVIAQQLMASMSPEGQIMNMLSGAFNQASGENPTEGNGNVGRPPSFENEPRLVSKDGGERTTITT